MGQPDFSQFKLRVNIKTSVENAYQAWATPAGLKSWFLGRVVITDENGVDRKPDEMAKANDDYSFFFANYPDTVGLKGKILKANDKNVFSFSFSKDVPVTITIYSEGGETIVELIESNMATDMDNVKKQYCGDSKGWVFYLTNLKSILEGGLDLRNNNTAISNVITH
jgi:uncharacterized protein YndB with AHSA1/START domain